MLHQIDVLGNRSFGLVNKPSMSVLSKESLLLFRYGHPINTNYPIAFTRPTIFVSGICDFDEDFGCATGYLYAELLIQIAIYDERDPVKIEYQGRSGTRANIIAHEEEHARDLEKKFREMLNLAEFASETFSSPVVCQRNMARKSIKFKNQFMDWSNDYTQREKAGLIPKFADNGEFDVKGNYL